MAKKRDFDELIRRRAKYDSENFMECMEREAEQRAKWTISNAEMDLPLNTNGDGGLSDTLNATSERSNVHHTALMYAFELDLSGEEGYAAYCQVEDAYCEYIKKGIPANDDFDISSVYSLDDLKLFIEERRLRKKGEL